MNVINNRNFKTQNIMPVLSSTLREPNLVVGTHLAAADVIPDVNAWTALHVDMANMMPRPDSRGESRKCQVAMDLVLEALSGFRNITATASVSLPLDNRPSQLGYYGWLRRLGWHLDVTSLLLDVSGRLCEKSDVDEAVRRRIRESADNPYVDTIYVFSGDGGMASSVRYAVRAGKRVIVISWSGTLNPALAAAASGFAFVDDLATLIGRPNFH